MKRVYFIISLIVLAFSLKAQVSEQEFQALKALYNATGGDNWTDRTGWENINTTATKNDVTTAWKGISFISEGHVIDITFYDNNLTGSLPEEISGLKYLRGLALNVNHMTSPLPQALKELTSITVFAMKGSDLNIPFPSDFITSWPDLGTLDLSSCGITGPIPDIFDKTPLLWNINISSNNIEGELPPSLDSLNLNEFHCDYNNLEGPLPQFTNSVDIYRLTCTYNNFTGTIPEHYGDFDLQYFQINDNKLSGSIPEKMFETPIFLFNIQNNYFTFADIEPVIDKINESTVKNFDTRKYFPLILDTVFLNEGDPLTLDASALSVYHLGGSNNQYKWLLKAVEVYSGNSPIYTIPSVTIANAGFYQFQVTNSAVTDMTLNSQAIVVMVKKVNHNPTEITLSKSSVDENSEGLVGTLSTTDPDAGDIHTFSLVTGDGTTNKDNNKFSISGNQLTINTKVDFELTKTLNILIGVNDGNGGTAAKAFTITVNNVNESPQFIGQVTGKTIDETASNGFAVLNLTAQDPENDPITFSINQGNESSAFGISNSVLVVADRSKLNYETKDSYSLVVSASDGTLSTDITLTVKLNNVIENYSVTASGLPLAGGTTSISSGIYAAGDSVAMTATPAIGYEFVNWTVNGVEVSTFEEYSFIVSEEIHLTANFSLKKYSVTISSNNSAWGYTNFATKSFGYGETVSVSAMSNWGYRFVNWTENGTEVTTESYFSFIVLGDRTLIANFESVNGINNPMESALNIYPNPATDFITITGLEKGSTIKLVTLSGSIIHREVSENSNVKIDVNALRNGFYLVVVEGDNGSFTRRIVIE